MNTFQSIRTRKLSPKILVAAASFALISCDKGEDPTVQNYQAPASAVLIACEGSFMSNNGSVWVYNPETGRVDAEVFRSVNGEYPGDVVQSVALNEGKAYVVVNNSGKVEVADASTWKRLATISTGLSQPRYIAFPSATKAYVTDWTNGVVIVGLTTHTVTGTITVGSGAEGILVASSGEVYVANSGGFGSGTSVSVIDPTTDMVTTTVTVPDGPLQLVEDGAGDIWVLCRGDFGDHVTPGSGTSSHLVRIDGTSHMVTRDIDFADPDTHAERLVGDGGDTLFFTYNGVYKLATDQTVLPGSPISARYFYGLAYDPNRAQLYAGDAKDFASRGWIIGMSKSGALLDSAQVGIAPNGGLRY